MTMPVQKLSISSFHYILFTVKRVFLMHTAGREYDETKCFETSLIKISQKGDLM